MLSARFGRLIQTIYFQLTKEMAERVMIFYLDTSAINSLFDDLSLAQLLPAISKRALIYPSIFNVAEIGATPDKARRLGLLKLTKQISRNYRPLALPSDLLKRALTNIKMRAESMDHSMGPEWDGVWLALNEPSLIDGPVYEETVEWKRNQEEWFHDMHKNGRTKMQAYLDRLSASDRVSLVSRFSGLARQYSPEGEFVRGVVADLATRSGAKVEIDRELVNDILRYSEHWKFFLASMIYGLFSRGVRQKNFSKNKNPGSIDSQQAVYLAACDVFVTSDKQQRRMLRLLVPFGLKKRAVWTFKQFKDFCTKIG